MAQANNSPLETPSSIIRTKPALRWLPLSLVAAAFLGLGALIAFGIPLLRHVGASPSERLRLSPAPDFTVPLYSGGEGSFTLSQQQGRPVVLNFWASWCAPCRAEFPALQAAAEKYAPQGVVLFGAAVQDTENESREFLQQQNTTFMTGPDTDGKLTLSYEITGLPATYFITRDGHIYKKWIGQIDEQRLDTFILEMLQL
ncbi:MAG: TlpA family protein disulfide reductase [Chloroflexi bacterium]|nr:TlpA family protein disulfide reductase [Chloroflexota bacterium]